MGYNEKIKYLHPSVTSWLKAKNFLDAMRKVYSLRNNIYKRYNEHMFIIS